jgi:hypothetical protein
LMSILSSTTGAPISLSFVLPFFLWRRILEFKEEREEARRSTSFVRCKAKMCEFKIMYFT